MTSFEVRLKKIQEEKAKERNQLLNEANRIMFNMETAVELFCKLAVQNESKGLKIRRNIRALIENGQYTEAKIATEKLVETSHQIVSINVIDRKLKGIVKILNEKLENVKSLGSELIDCMRKVDDSIRVGELAELDKDLNKIKKYLCPDQANNRLSVRLFKNYSRDTEVTRVYNEIYDEVQLISSLAGN